MLIPPYRFFVLFVRACLIISLSTGSALGQELIFRNIGDRLKLPSYECYNVVQDRKGYIWISTDNGLCRYNGKAPVIFNRKNGNLVYASGQTPVTWQSNANSGYVRFFLHSNPSRGQQSSYRTKSVKCVALGPSCLAPASAFTSGVTSNGATLAWTASAQPPANGYNYNYSTSNVAPTAATTPTGNSNTSVITPILNTNTTYYFRVRANCGSSQSNWVSGGSFTTSPAAGCTNALHALYPSNTFTPACSGSQETIIANAWASEYSNITVLPGKQYTFRSSVPTDYVTITNASGSTIYAGGTSPLVWNSNSVWAGRSRICTLQIQVLRRTCRSSAKESTLSRLAI